MHKTITAPEIGEIIGEVSYGPTISIILPFDPKMIAKSEISLRLKNAAIKVEKELLGSYSAEMVFLMMQKLQKSFNQLNFSTHTTSIAIYLSPVFEKLLYLNVPVEERVLVNKSFEIRDLLYTKKQLRKYLLLKIGTKGCEIYLGDTASLVPIVSIKLRCPMADLDDLSDKYLQQVDNSLGIILGTYQLPLFVMGSKEAVRQFMRISGHQNSVFEFLYGEYEHILTDDLKHILAPHVNDWDRIKETALIQKLEAAAEKHKLVTGIKDVWNDTAHHRGSLLVLEKKFIYSGCKGKKEDQRSQAIASFAKYSYIKDAVDEIIEKVLENGGDVEFVEEGVLNSYGRIALIK